FRSLLLVLVLVLIVRSSPHGRVIHPQPRKHGSSVRLSEECLNQKDLKFPTMVNVDIRISKAYANMLYKCIKLFCVPIPRLDEDPNRFPQVIADAECRLSSCVNPQGQEDYSLNSVPIQQEILVLRREQEGCLPTYRLEKKIITVGCTCAAPIVYRHS
ncbi:Interleukin-17F, partial [Dryobates pubescens]